MLIKKLQSTAEIFSENSGGVARGPRVSDLFSSTGAEASPTHQCYWGASDDFLGLPVVILPATGELETLFADVSTYYERLSPISAYVHVVETEFAPHLGIKVKKYSPSKIIVQQRDIGVFVSLAFGEVETSRFSGGHAEDVASYSTCRRTLAYALARTAILYPNYESSAVAADWRIAREWARMDTSSNIATTVASIVDWAGRKDVRTNSTSSIDARVRQYIQGEIEHHDFQAHLIRLYPGIEPLIEKFQGAFDRRMAVFDSVAKIVLSGNQEVSENDAICLAFFCNSISPGVCTYANLLGQWRDRYPTIIIWYYLFNALSEDFSWQSLADGVGQKLGRDLTQSFSLESRPLCDISISELKVLSRGQISQSGVKPTQQRALLVSLLPGVDTYVRFSGEPDGGVEAVDYRRANELASKEKKVRKLLNEAISILDSGDSHNKPHDDAYGGRAYVKSRKF